MGSTLGRNFLLRLDAGAVLVQDAFYFSLLHVRESVFADAHDRSEAAASDAANRLHRELAVGAVAARIDAGFGLRAFQHQVAAAHVTCRAGANLHQVLAARLQAEAAVEGSDLINLGNRDLKFARDAAQGFFW